MTRYLTLLFALLLSVTMASPHAAALTLDEVKRDKLVGELPNGYLGLVNPNAPAAVKQFVDDINLQRRQAYRDIAAKSNTTLENVEAITGKKLIERARSGEYVKTDVNGAWTQAP